jgi:hypothetical protein
MKFTELRTQLENWLEKETRLDKWSIDTPEALYTEINNKLYPTNTIQTVRVKAVDYFKDRDTTRLIFDFFITYRFEGSRSIEVEIPINQIEGLLLQIHRHFEKQWSGFNEDITSAKGLINKDLIQITRDGEEFDDWLVTGGLSFSLDVLIEDEDFPDINPPNPEDPDVDFKSLSIRTYRSIRFPVSVVEAQLDKDFIKE